MADVCPDLAVLVDGINVEPLPKTFAHRRHMELLVSGSVAIWIYWYICWECSAPRVCPVLMLSRTGDTKILSPSVTPGDSFAF